MCSTSNVLETATSRMEVGSRRARLAARAMRSRTSASRDRIAAGSITISFLQLGHQRLGLRGVRTLRRELHVVFEFTPGPCQVAFLDGPQAHRVSRPGAGGIDRT